MTMNQRLRFSGINTLRTPEGVKLEYSGKTIPRPLVNVCEYTVKKEFGIMIYKEEDGLRVAQEGFVIIEGTEHYVKNGFVACNASLNSRAWNTTKKEKECNQCARFKRGGQLELF